MSRLTERRRLKRTPSPRAVVAVCLAYAGTVLVLGDSHLVPLLVIAGTFALAVIGLDLVVGYAGLLALSAPAFMTVGAMSTALIAKETEFEPAMVVLAGIGVGLVLSAVLGLLVGLATLRIGGIALALATLFLLFVVNSGLREFELFGGSIGLAGLPRFELGPIEATADTAGGLLMAVVLLIGGLTAWAYVTGDVGRELRAINADEVAAAASGIAVGRRRIEVYVLSCLYASLAGSLYAHMVRYVSADSFNVHTLLALLLAMYLGGARSVWGAVPGAALVYVIPEAVSALGSTKILAQGLAFVAILVLFPQGLVGVVDRLTRVVRNLAGGVGAPGPQLPARSATGSPQPTSTVVPLTATTSHNGTGRDQPMLRVDNVTKRFGGVQALDRVNLELEACATHALVGPNGAGKSTLFDVIAGSAAPTEGSVTFRGEDVSAVGPIGMARRGVRRTFQRVRVFEAMTVFENVLIGTGATIRLGAHQAFVPLSTQGVERAEATIELLDLQALAYRPAGEQPLGVQRRIEVARALAGDPTLLLLDEPASGLSSGEREELLAVLQDLRGRLTLLVVEHDVGFVSKLAERLTVLDSGVLIYDGDVEEGLCHEDVVAAYLGSPPATPDEVLG